jgi:hypothetical protein
MNPLVMKRKWRGMLIKGKNNYDESQHVDTSLSFLPLDVGDIVHHFFLHMHEFEDPNSLTNGEFEDLVEDALTSAHEEKNMVIFSHIDGFMKEPLDLVDEHIDRFILSNI